MGGNLCFSYPKMEAPRRYLSTIDVDSRTRSLVDACLKGADVRLCCVVRLSLTCVPLHYALRGVRFPCSAFISRPLAFTFQYKCSFSSLHSHVKFLHWTLTPETTRQMVS